MARTKHNCFLLITIIALALSGVSAQAAKPAKKPAKPVQAAKPSPTKKVNVLTGTALALPSDCKVKVRWACPPLDAKAVEASHWYDVSFIVDNTGRPWFGYGSNNLVNPTGQYQFTMDQLYEDLVCLDNGTFLVSTASDLGFITPPEKPKLDYDGMPMVLFQPIAGLPVPECKLFHGAGNCLYLMGQNPATDQYEVYLLRPEKLPTLGTGVREYMKVFSSKQEIVAVAGDGNVTYVAIDQVILKAVLSGGAAAKVYASPTETIKGLAYSPQVGLFCATSKGIGRIGSNGMMQILATEDPRIYLQKGSLYVLFPKTLGVLSMDNVEDLKRFDLAIKEVPATQSNEVEVTDVRFFEAGDAVPEYGDRKYAAKFDKASTRFIYCQVDMTNLLKGKRMHTQLVTMELCPPGETQGESQEVRLDLTPDVPSLAGWARFGDVNPNSFYPGAYTLKTYLNGGKIDDRRFTIEGEASLLEAAYFKDTARLWKLLGAGADPNEKAQDGRTPLIMAVSNGSLEQVRLLLDHKADANIKDDEGQTPLLIASGSYSDNSAIVRLLLENGADANAADKDGSTSLHKAAEHNETEVMRLLLEHGANPNARDMEQCTPLLKLTLGLKGTKYQAKSEHLDMLLSHGADANAAGKDVRSVLASAIGGGDPELVRILVKHGANVNLIQKYEDGTEYSPLWTALLSYDMERNRWDKAKLKEIVGILCDNGANLLADEGTTAVGTEMINVLGRKQIVNVLQQNNDAVFTYQPNDPWLRKFVLQRIVNLAYYDISSATDTSWYEAALKVSLAAVDRAEKWKMDAEIPYLYYNCGILCVKVGNSANAKTYLQKFLDLAPNAPDAAKAQAMLNSL